MKFIALKTIKSRRENSKLKKYYTSLGVPSILCFLELSRPIPIEMAVQPVDGLTGRGRNM
jgi:hypothetical protein